MFNLLLFSPSCSTNMFFLQLLQYCWNSPFFIGILPETQSFLLAFYRYFRENLDSVIFLRPRWQPWIRILCELCVQFLNSLCAFREALVQQFGPLHNDLCRIAILQTGRFLLEANHHLKHLPALDDLHKLQLFVHPHLIMFSPTASEASSSSTPPPNSHLRGQVNISAYESAWKELYRSV